MKEFSNMGIKVPVKNFEGDKISIEALLEKKIQVNAYRIVDSKYEKGNGKCLHLQIEINSEKRVLFSGSGYLMEVLEKIEEADFPFLTTIRKVNRRLEFT